MFINFAKNGDYDAMKHLELGFVGFGLIGGSIARALKKQNEDVSVHVYSRRKNPALDEGMAEGIIDSIWYEIDERFSTCDIIFLCAPVLKNADYLSVLKPLLKPGCILTDVGSVKGNICKKAAELGLSRQFIGGHPMAGRHFSGYAYSTKTMYNGASMVLVPEDLNDTKSIERAKKLLSPIHFGKFTICDYDRHDAMIAFTSQMAHVVSNAYVKSPTAKNHDGFSAGSYKDLTRVAWLNETMWTELFLENKKHLIKELDYFITALKEYKTAMENDDAETLKKLLADGKHCKEEIDGITGE